MQLSSWHRKLPTPGTTKWNTTRPGEGTPEGKLGIHVFIVLVGSWHNPARLCKDTSSPDPAAALVQELMRGNSFTSDQLQEVQKIGMENGNRRHQEAYSQAYSSMFFYSFKELSPFFIYFLGFAGGSVKFEFSELWGMWICVMWLEICWAMWYMFTWSANLWGLHRASPSAWLAYHVPCKIWCSVDRKLGHTADSPQSEPPINRLARRDARFDDSGQERGSVHRFWSWGIRNRQSRRRPATSNEVPAS